MGSVESQGIMQHDVFFQPSPPTYIMSMTSHYIPVYPEVSQRVSHLCPMCSVGSSEVLVGAHEMTGGVGR